MGFHPEQITALGENVILLTNLAWSAWLLLGFLRRKHPFAPWNAGNPVPRGLRRIGLDRSTSLPTTFRLRIDRRAGALPQRLIEPIEVADAPSHSSKLAQ